MPESTASTDRFPRWLWILIAVLGAIMITLQFLKAGDLFVIYDAFSYTAAWERLKMCLPDAVRPPVYPLFYGIITTIFPGTTGMVVIAVLQWSLFGVAIWMLWRILVYFEVTRAFRVATILLLLFFPGNWVMNNALQTESLSLFLITFLVYSLIRYRQRQTRLWNIAGAITTFLLVYLKPQFIYIIPIYLAAWWICSANRKQTILTVTSSLLIAGSLFFYTWTLRRFCGFNQGLTVVGTVNCYGILRMGGLVTPDDIENPDIREHLRPYLEADPGSDLLETDLYGVEWKYMNLVQCDSINRNVIPNHPAEVAGFLLSRFPRSFSHSIFPRHGYARPYDGPKHRRYYALTGKKQPSLHIPEFTYGEALTNGDKALRGSLVFPFYGILDIPFIAAYITLALFTGITLLSWKKSGWKRFPTVAFTLIALISGGYITTLAGAYDDWGRIAGSTHVLLFAAGGIVVYKSYRYVQFRLKRRQQP